MCLLRKKRKTTTNFSNESFLQISQIIVALFALPLEAYSDRVIGTSRVASPRVEALIVAGFSQRFQGLLGAFSALLLYSLLMATLNDQESAIETFMEILEEHQRNSVRLGKYVEAEVAGKRLDELRAHEEARRREALRARQLAEVLAVEEAHMLEFQQFNAMWDAKMQTYEVNGDQLMGAMRERHSDELRDFQQKLVSKASQPRHSKEYCNLTVIQMRLASQKNYAAAAKVKVKADELLAYEEEKGSNEKQLEMLHRENIFKVGWELGDRGPKHRVKLNP